MNHILLAAFAVISSVVGWGGDGHRIVASLAESLISSRYSESLLGSLDLVQASVWADTDKAKGAYPMSSAYHYSNTPYRRCDRFKIERDCGFGRTKGLCIVTGLTDAIMQAIDVESSDQIRTDALKFIVHFMADIHQPLHTGFREDTGGIRILLSDPPDVDLRTVWDNTLIQKMMEREGYTDWNELGKALGRKLESGNGQFIARMKNETNWTEILTSKSAILQHISRLASETSQTVTCRSAYKDENSQWIGVGDSVTDEFFVSRSPMVAVQLLKASVRLSLLVDAIADVLRARRLEVKDARRTERIGKLFQTDPVSCKDDFGSGSNPFGALFLEFDPIESEVTSDEVPVTRKVIKPRQTEGVAKVVDETAILDKAVAAVASERSSYTFFGIDLSEIVYVNRKRVMLVSTKSRIANPRYMPSVVVVPVTFASPDGGTFTTHSFGLDSNVFPSEMRDELIVRVMLKTTGVDPRIDITDYMKSIKPQAVVTVEESPVLDYLVAQHVFRIESRKMRMSAIDEIKSLGKKILSFVVQDGIAVYMRFDTMKNYTDSRPVRMRLNRFQINGQDDRTVYVDPSITDRPFESATVFVLLKRLSEKNLKIAARYTRSSLWDQLKEAERFMRLRDRGLEGNSQMVGASHIEWLFDYPGDSGRRHTVVEWFVKGVASTQDDLMDYLGIPRLPRFPLDPSENDNDRMPERSTELFLNPPRPQLTLTSRISNMSILVSSTILVLFLVSISLFLK